jgi:Flp pilus assembly protein TadD
VLRKLGKNEEAAAEFRKALALDANQQKAKRNLAALTGEK